MLDPSYIFAPHQDEAHRRMEEDPSYPLFFDMGCFKTSTIIGHVERSRHAYKHVLIVVLKDNLKTWKDEFDERITTPDYSILPDGLNRRMDCLRRYTAGRNVKYLVVNYDCVRSDSVYALLREKAKGFDYICFDEAYATYNVKTKRNQRWYQIRKKIPRCTVMDGDPTAEGEDKLFGIYKMCDMGRTFGTDYWAFMLKYFVRVQDTFWVPGRFTLTQINEVLKRTSMRVEKKDVLPWLPPVVYERRIVKMLPQQAKMYNQMAKEFAVELKSGDILEVDYKISQIHKLRQITGGFMYVTDEPAQHIANAKLPPLKETMRQCSKLVIYANYREEIELIAETARAMGRNPVVYHGGVSSADKIAHRDAFKHSAYVTDFICQNDCAIGMNELAVSGTALYYSRSEKRRSRSQSVARLDRPGQEHDKVTIIDIIAHSTIDEHNHKKLIKKGRRSEVLLNYRDNDQVIGAIRGRI